MRLSGADDVMRAFNQVARGMRTPRRDIRKEDRDGGLALQVRLQLLREAAPQAACPRKRASPSSFALGNKRCGGRTLDGIGGTAALLLGLPRLRRAWTPLQRPNAAAPAEIS